MDIRSPGLEWWQSIAITLAMIALIPALCFALVGLDLLWQRRQDHYWRHPSRRRLTERGARRFGLLWHAAVDGMHRRVVARTPVVVEPHDCNDHEPLTVVQQRHALDWTLDAEIVDEDKA